MSSPAPQSREQIADAVVRCIDAKDLRKALAICQQLNRGHADYAYGWYLASFLMQKVRHYQDAIRAIDRALQLASLDMYQLHKIRCHFEANDQIRMDNPRAKEALQRPMEEPESRVAGRTTNLDECLRFEHLISDLSARFVTIPPDRVDPGIEESLEQILDFFEVDRCALLHDFPDKASWQITHVASREDVPPLPRGTTLPVSFNPWAYDKLIRKREVLPVSRLDDLPPEANVDKQTWIGWRIRSTLTIPILAGGPVDHAITLHLVKREKIWPEEHFSRLRLLGDYANLPNNRYNKLPSGIYRTKKEYKLPATSSVISVITFIKNLTSKGNINPNISVISQCSNIDNIDNIFALPAAVVSSRTVVELDLTDPDIWNFTSPIINPIVSLPSTLPTPVEKPMCLYLFYLQYILLLPLIVPP